MKRPVDFIRSFSKKHVGLLVDEECTMSNDKMLSKYRPTLKNWK